MEYMKDFPTLAEWLNEEGEIEFVDSPIPDDPDLRLGYLREMLRRCFDEIIEDQDEFTDADVTVILKSLKV